MEQTVTERPRVLSPALASASTEDKPIYTKADLVTEDPAFFLVAHHIYVTDQTSVAAVKKYFSRTPAILEIVDEVLAGMEKAELISIQGDRIELKQQFLDFGDDVSNLRRFLPRLFMIAADRVLEDAEVGAHRAKKDAIRYWAIPNDQKSTIEAQAAYLEYRNKMNAIAERVKTENRCGENVRLVGTFSCSLSPEDFS